MSAVKELNIRLEALDREEIAAAVLAWIEEQEWDRIRS